MKTLIAFALAAAAVTNAHAGDAMYAENKAGGYIVLTDDASNCDPGHMYYYVTDANGTKLDRGCYTLEKPWVVATAYDGKVYHWAEAGFEPTAYGNAKYGN